MTDDLDREEASSQASAEGLETHSAELPKEDEPSLPALVALRHLPDGPPSPGQVIAMA